MENHHDIRYNINVLDKSIEILKGIGEKRKVSLNAMGIYTIRDLLYHFPYKYKDITQREHFSRKEKGDEIVAWVKITGKPFFKRKSRALNFISFYVTDNISKAKCIFFNQPYLLNKLNIGDEFLIIGTIKKENSIFQVINPKIIRPDDNTPDILTQYRLPNTVNQKSFASVVKKAFDTAKSQLSESLPEKLRTHYGLCTVNFAIEQVHFPTNMHSLNSAQSRLAFEEMFFFILVLRRLRKIHQSKNTLAMPAKDADIAKLIDTLPYSLTYAQTNVISEIRYDMSGKNDDVHIMNRLLQGDVGCGKTIVAIIAIYIAYLNDYQSAMMAPTEILAKQHYSDCVNILEPLGMKVSLLTSSMSASDKKAIKQELAEGKTDLIVGTHAIIQKGVVFDNLGLAITDEQHRFGVNQRALLSHKGGDCHMLVMSATPVPRTLALILYGDLDISVIDELPPGRKQIKTRLVEAGKRQDMYKYIAESVSQNQQAYIVCPLIEESEKLDVLSASELYAELKKGFFKDINIGILHGRISDKEKQQLIKHFSEGKIRALVSTTVIEVGVNVPGATIMVIENAERFGLAQLHQLRGRVGRNDMESWCFMTTQSRNQTSLSRLKTMTETNDGFLIAQRDLDLRGPGQFIGLRQSGLLDKRVTALINDYKLVQEVKEAVDKTESGEFGDCLDELLAEASLKYSRKLKDIVLN